MYVVVLTMFGAHMQGVFGRCSEGARENSSAGCMLMAKRYVWLAIQWHMLHVAVKLAANFPAPE